jgi:hypothetical protein
MAWHRAQCEEEPRRRALEEVLAGVLGRRLRVRFETAAAEPAAEEAPEAPAAPGAAPAAPAAPAAAARAPSAAPAPGDFDRLRHEEVAGLAEAPAVRALGREFQVRLVRAGRRRAEPAAPGGAEGATGEETE